MLRRVSPGRGSRLRRSQVKYVIEQIERRKRSVAEHPFYRWLRSDAVPLEDRFIFAPVFVNFIMSFSDMNKWFMRYRAPSNEFERVINRHTFEDETHSRLFIEDWRKLGFDRRLGWTAGDMIGWYFAAPETEIFREYGMEIMKMSTLYEDPCLRFAFMEAIEACGNVFFTATAPVADKLNVKSGQVYRYFGDYHLSREVGHIAAGERIFGDVELDEWRKKKASELVDRIFDMFKVENDNLLSYAGRALREGPRRGREGAALRGGREDRGSRRSPASETEKRHEPRIAPSNEPVQRLLDERRRGAARHALFQWMQDTDGTPAEKKLQRIVPLWTPDVMGYKDLNTYALRYKDPADNRERAINRWVTNLTSHHRLFVRDWTELGMDKILGWTASDTLSFYGLSKHTEVQRKSMSSFIKLAFTYPEPALRFWLIEALEASGEAFFYNTSVLARRVESQGPKRLDYLANRHEEAHPALERDDEADAVAFKSDVLGPTGREIAAGMIETVFDCLEEQLSLSLELASRDTPQLEVR
jgi:hypothetical protein